VCNRWWVKWYVVYVSLSLSLSLSLSISLYTHTHTHTGLSKATQQQLLLAQLLGLQSSLALFYRNAKRKSTQAEELVKVIQLTEEARGKTNPTWWENNKLRPLKDRKRTLECERELLIRGHESAKKKLQPLWRAVQKLVTPSVIKSQAKYDIEFQRLLLRYGQDLYRLDGIAMHANEKNRWRHPRQDITDQSMDTTSLDYLVRLYVYILFVVVVVLVEWTFCLSVKSIQSVRHSLTHTHSNLTHTHPSTNQHTYTHTHLHADTNKQAQLQEHLTDLSQENLDCGKDKTDMLRLDR